MQGADDVDEVPQWVSTVLEAPDDENVTGFKPLEHVGKPGQSSSVPLAGLTATWSHNTSPRESWPNWVAAANAGMRAYPKSLMVGAAAVMCLLGVCAVGGRALGEGRRY